MLILVAVGLQIRLSGNDSTFEAKPLFGRNCLTINC